MKNKGFHMVFGLFFYFTSLFAQLQVEAPFKIAIQEINFPDNKFIITDFGAKEGGEMKCTRAINNAIAAATDAGGGYVVVPRGTWLSGPIILRDNVCLTLEDSALILFSDDFNDYLPPVYSRHQGNDCYKHSALIYANGAENIGITGNGILHGQGKKWWEWRQIIREQYGKDNVPDAQLQRISEEGATIEERVFDGKNNNALMPCFIMPIKCKRILIQDIKVLYGPYWTVNPVYCDNIIIRNVSVQTIGEYGETGNGDGINLSSCTNALIEGCTLDTGDDCITMKSGRGYEGYLVGKPTQNVVVRNCVSLRGHGGVVIGSETSGGIRNIYVHDCTFNGTDRGLRIKTARGRGDAIENIWFENITMDRIMKEMVRIHMLRYTSRYPEHEITRLTPRIRNIYISNIECGHVFGDAVSLTGMPEMPIENVVLENIKVKKTDGQGIKATDVTGAVIKNFDVSAESDVLFSFDHASNFIVEDLVKFDKSKEVLITGTEDAPSYVRFINCDIPQKNVRIENNSGEIQMLKGGR